MMMMMMYFYEIVQFKPDRSLVQIWAAVLSSAIMGNLFTHVPLSPSWYWHKLGR